MSAIEQENRLVLTRCVDAFRSVSLTLPHPRTLLESRYYWHNGELLEMVPLRDNGSCFIGNICYSEGRVWCMIPLDPLFMWWSLFQHLPVARSAQTLDALFLDASPSVQQFADIYIKDVSLLETLHCLCQYTKVDDLVVLRYDAQRSWQWCQAKLEHLAKHLLDSNWLIKRHAPLTHESALRWSARLFSSYLTCSIFEKLDAQFHLTAPLPSVPGDTNVEPQPLEDYTKIPSSLPPPVKQVQKKGKLSSADSKGMPTLAAMFKKRTG